MSRIIALIEDNPAEAATIQSYLDHMSSALADPLQVKWFRSGSEFLSAYKPVYDIVLMDIMLPGLNGMDTARHLRTMDKNVVLIFITNMAQYAVKGYEVDAIDFIVKPVLYPIFTVKIKRALALCVKRQAQDLLLSVSDGMFRTSSSRIKYVETCAGHNLIYHTVDGNLEAIGSLKQVEEQLQGAPFFRCNRCYLVNLAYVEAVQGATVVVDGEELQISRPKRSAFIEALNTYLGGGSKT